MAESKTRRLTIEVDAEQSVSGLLLNPPRARACYAFAHGAGAGMTHPFMETVASDLAARGIATLRYQFPYMERRSKRPDSPKVAQAAVRAAVAEASRATSLPLIAGGKSFGGRMTSQAQAAAPLSGVVGLAFLGFPLHPAGQPTDDRAAHLADVKIPMLFLQGTRDSLADQKLLERVIKRLKPRATLRMFDNADHSFHVPKSARRTDADVRKAMLDAFADWVDALIG